MDVRAIVRPDQGTQLHYLRTLDDSVFPSLELANHRVEDILNALVTRQSYGAWVLYPLTNDLQKSAGDQQFVTLISYADGPSRLGNISCSPPQQAPQTDANK
jgi:hypothetical protein